MQLATVAVTVQEYARVKAMRGACSVTRPELDSIHYNAAESRLEATDGRILRLESVEKEAWGNTSFVIGPRYFNESRAQQRAAYGDMWIKGRGVATITIAYPDDTTYPDISKVIPSIDRYKRHDNAPLVAIDLDVIVRFRKTVVVERGLCGIVFVPTTTLGPIMVYSAEPDDEYGPATMRGLIMPIRLPAAIDDIQAMGQEEKIAKAA